MQTMLRITDAMSWQQRLSKSGEACTIYKKICDCLPGTHISVQRIKDVLSRENMTILTEETDNDICAIAAYEKDHVLLLCTFPAYRMKGIGNRLLQKAESELRIKGYKSIKCCAGDTYITPGVPENGANWDFFRKRGYFHNWNGCECLDMSVSKDEMPEIRECIGSAINGMTYRIARLEDIPRIKLCVDDACEEFTQYYLRDALYSGNENEFVLIADDGSRICGTLIVERDINRNLGSVGCTATATAFQNRGIATNMIRIATKHLFGKGVEECWLGYTYTDIVSMYSRAGYRPCMRYMMAEKPLV